MVLSKDDAKLEGRIEMHLDGGYSKIRIYIGGRTIDVPTEKIPPHLRGLGSRVLVIFKAGSRSFTAPRTGETAYLYEDIVVQDLPKGWAAAE